MPDVVPHIRRAQPQECTTISALGIRSKSHWNYSSQMMATFRSELTLLAEDIQKRRVYVVTIDNTIVGYYSLREIDSKAIELEHLFVDPDYLKRGYGSQMFHHAMEVIKSKGFSRLVIQSDPNASGFYEKLGIPLVKKISSSIPGRSIPCFEKILQTD
ncbi:GNAT family N-acetyltransferase [Gimesia aquarii]|uniref:Putative N-acetyltransferase YafP n=1 Tax=Gimesia aquarii TaxID=2527964 RepID=A0A517WTY7_9PLAN|nr:GNAT family N-acetyltransferase [Gimesia aquarii]QDU08688.1 putative N-acetyltransferase YafP [Gimesia aquarii]